ncbi:uncharacterized protein LOC141846989 [Curcuma longa]|uniref:uncharacterized protein LOC141846989 n=1 Tax=Curcuma longa TaxID=136217 RepID=UPI003D9F0A06
MPKVPDPPHDYDTEKYEKVVALINEHRAQYSSRIVVALVEEHRAQFVVDEARQVKLPLNLMGDSVLHEVIARRKTDLAVAIIDGLNSNEVDMFRPKNYYGDTPLHIAAAVGDSKVAEALLKKHKELARERNRKGETPLHKAVQCGHFGLFFSIIKWHGDRSIANDRTGDGSTILHYAIMSNHPDGALRIAKLFPKMIQTRNSAGATPLQIMVAFLKKPSELGIFESLLYKLILTWGKVTSTKAWKTADEESGHEKNESFEFYFKGFNCPKKRMMASNAGDGKNPIQEQAKSQSTASDDVSGAKDRRIWQESPLITGVKLGLDEFVIKILKVCPQSATYVGCDGMNVLQAAVKYDRRKVVKAIKEDEQLPSWLFTDLESDTKNTLLHIAAADKSIQNEADPLRLQDELVGFEMLKEIVPEELWNCRNEAEKTAREVFDEKHEATLKNCRGKLAEIGKACSPLVAAVVFTSSFYIRSENNRDSNRVAYKVFSHAYVLAFSFAATSLVMFLLLVVTPFKQRDFRRVVPWHYLMAFFLLALSLVAFIIAFACNIYLQIHGGQWKSHADLATLLLELLLVPFLCVLALFLAGASWRFGSVIGRLTK